MDDLKPQKKNRFEKGSQEAKDFMATLRAKKRKENTRTTSATSTACFTTFAACICWFYPFFIRT